MNVAMAITSFLCIFIGCYTPYLYKMLPYPVLAAGYQPYTAYHVFETLQILLFTGLGFFLLLQKLVPEPTVSLDMDWFYRKGGRAFYWVARKPVQTVDTFIGELYRYAGLLPLMLTAKVSGLFDNYVIDGAVDGFAESFRGIGRRLRFLQRGQMQQNLAFAFAVAAALMVAYLVLIRWSPLASAFHAPDKQPTARSVDIPVRQTVEAARADRNVRAPLPVDAVKAP
jgi:multicomponent Na+:H+ antiporter subunit D